MTAGGVARRGTMAVAALLAGCATGVEAPPGNLADAAARYVCTDGTGFTARFDRWGESAVLSFEGRDRYDPDATSQDRGFRIALAGQRVASGMGYAGGGWSLRGKGDAATLTRPDGRTSDCTAGSNGAGGPVPPPAKRL